MPDDWGGALNQVAGAVRTADGAESVGSPDGNAVAARLDAGSPPPELPTATTGPEESLV